MKTYNVMMETKRTYTFNAIKAECVDDAIETCEDLMIGDEYSDMHEEEIEVAVYEVTYNKIRRCL